MESLVQFTLIRLKEWMKDSVWFSDGMLHLNIGLALFLIAALLLRRKPRGVLIAWTIVLVLQTLNETFDAWVGYGRSGRVDWIEMGKDFVATMFWPTVLLMIWKRLFCLPPDTKP